MAALLPSLVPAADAGGAVLGPWGLGWPDHRCTWSWCARSSVDCGARSVIPSWPRGSGPALLSGTRSPLPPDRLAVGDRGQLEGYPADCGWEWQSGLGRRDRQVFLSGAEARLPTGDSSRHRSPLCPDPLARDLWATANIGPARESAALFVQRAPGNPFELSGGGLWSIEPRQFDRRTWAS